MAQSESERQIKIFQFALQRAIGEDSTRHGATPRRFVLFPTLVFCLDFSRITGIETKRVDNRFDSSG